MIKNPLREIFSSITFPSGFNFLRFYIILNLVLLVSCQSEPDGDSIIDKSIATHGGDHLDEIDISFKFRDKRYVIHTDGGKYQYERLFSDSIGNVRDILSNDGFERFVNSNLIELTTEFKVKYSNSVNSVIYFALLPFGLDGKAVNKKLLAETEIKGIPYYEVLVTFDEDGGGEDYEDVFVFWIHREKYTMDYLAYAYHTEGGGTRFREAINTRKIEGILFQDYINYSYNGDSVDLHAYETLFEESKLDELSRIVLEDVEIGG